MTREDDHSGPMITEKEVSLMSLLGSHSADIDIDIPSPLSDTDLAEIVNFEAASWAVELRGIARRSPARTSSPEVAPSSDQGLQSYDLILGVPPIYHQLSDGGAPFWATVALDLRKFLWENLSQKLTGREPTKTLFYELHGEAMAKQISSWVPGNYFVRKFVIRLLTYFI